MNRKFWSLCVWTGLLVWAGMQIPAFAATPYGEKLYAENFFFSLNKIVSRSFVPAKGPGDLTAKTIIGTPSKYVVKDRETLLDIARFSDLGYNEITEPRPDVEPWLPPVGDELTLHTFWILPNSVHEGLVVNIPEMRMYYYPVAGSPTVITLPVGLGREDRPTPQAVFKVTGKVENPTWVIPDSIKAERIKEKGFSENAIAGGSPLNPMGKHRFDLTLPLVKIHGTNNPWAVGRMVTHGCIRMYPEDIKQFFDVVRLGCRGEFLYQTVKIGVMNGKVFAEVHRDIYGLVPNIVEEARKVAAESGYKDQIDMLLLEKAVKDQNGVPTDVTRQSTSQKTVAGN